MDKVNSVVRTILEIEFGYGYFSFRTTLVRALGYNPHRLGKNTWIRALGKENQVRQEPSGRPTLARALG